MVVVKALNIAVTAVSVAAMVPGTPPLPSVIVKMDMSDLTASSIVTLPPLAEGTGPAMSTGSVNVQLDLLAHTVIVSVQERNVVLGTVTAQRAVPVCVILVTLGQTALLNVEDLGRVPLTSAYVTAVI